MMSFRRVVCNIVSVIYTFFRLMIIKMIYPKCVSFDLIERFSPNVVINLDSKSRVKFGKRIRVHSYSRISANSGGELVINDDASFNIGCMITCKHRIIIGKNVTFGPRVMLFDHNHIATFSHGVNKNEFELGAITVGENTWIGAGTIILMNSKIGRNCVIAAGSVVKGNVPDNSVLIQKRNNIYKNLE